MRSVSTIERPSEAKATARAWPRVSERAVVRALVLVNLCVTLPLAYALNIWVDEAYTLHTTAGTVADAWRRAVGFELQPPLYFALLSLWRGIDGSIFFARLFSVVSIALTVYAAAAVSRRYVPRAHAGWLAALVALNPFAVWAATEIRVYALALLLSALLLLLFHDAYLARQPRPRARALYVLVSVVALYTHYYLGFILAANACALLISKHRRALRSYLISMTPVALCFAPLALQVREQIGTLNNSAGRALAPLEALKLLYLRLCDYALPLDWLPSQTLRILLLRLGSLALLCALALLLLRLRRRAPQLRDAATTTTHNDATTRTTHDDTTTSTTRNDRAPANTTPLVALTITTTATLLFILPLLSTGEAFTHARHTTALFLPALLSLVALLASFGRRKLLPAWTLLSLVFYTASLVNAYAPLAKPGDWQRVAAHIRAHEQPGQPVLVFRASAALPLAHYYRGPNPLVPLPRPADLRTYDLRAEIISDETDITAALARTPGDHTSLWLVTQTPCEYLGVNYNCAALESFIDKNYTTDSAHHFLNTDVRLLKKKD